MSSEPGPNGIRLTDAERRAQRRRSVAIAGVLVALVVIFYVVTLIKMGG
ncbi:hypothetical protein GGQ76_000938 [Aureimonas jatrophae]|jgi:hypothetical protein|uniref:Protoheme IX farnesyltransferase n=1 Tax=Aureimonas jatrophae TaxID=1166073 RepID=A0A1H0GNL8_9HYPH|nr:protoheme IX farnesyltransferase [Aureimonas jatrophae]MBB3949670.1 hypothetical protein [Aureimonas jatrophae]SDO08477.1 hypothetical protein SAMN05192530_103223 [Aureimonas jatrophae]